MRTIYLILAFISFSLGTMSQEVNRYNKKTDEVSFENVVDSPLLDSTYIYLMTSRKDSTLTSKIINVYNNTGQLTLQKNDIRYYLSGTHDLIDWYTNTYTEYSYDNKGNLVLRKEKVPDEDYVMVTYTSYSEKNEKSKEILIYCRDTGICDTVSIWNYMYDEINRKQIQSGISCGYRSQYGITYDDAENIIQTLTYSITTEGDSTIEERKEYTYNENKQLLTTKVYAILGNPSLFLNYEEFYFYNNNQLDSVAQYSYNYDGSMWNNLRELYTYQPNRKISTHTIIFFRDNKWNNSTIHYFYYNKDDQLITEETYWWYINQWEGQVKREYEYDSNGKRFRQLEYNSNFNWETGWKLYQTFFYFYQSKTNNTTFQSNTLDHPVYPNPTNGSFAVNIENPKGSNLEIYSTNGKLLHIQKLTNGINQVDYQFPAQGLYLVKIADGNKAQVQKIVIGY